MLRKAVSTLFLLTVLLLSAQPLRADTLPEGAGVVYGEGFAFNLKAPKGWTFDTSSGVVQGLNAVFYPNGGSWSGSPIVAYARSRSKTATLNTPEEAVKETVQSFHDKGSPKYNGKLIKTFKTDSGQEAVLYQFTGDQWGNIEAAAYIVEKDRINFLVMSSRDKELFDSNLPAFEALVKSYSPAQKKPSP